VRGGTEAGDQVEALVERVRRGLAEAISSGRDPRLRTVVAVSDCYLVGSHVHGRAGPGSDLDVLAFPEQAAQIEGVIAPFDTDGRRPGPGQSLDTFADVLHWRAEAELRNLEIEVLDPRARTGREADLANWAFVLESARLVHAGWGGGERYRAAVAERFAAECPALATRALVEFQRYRNQAQTTLFHGQPMAIALTSALVVRAALRAWLLWAARPLPSDKWLPAVVAGEAGSVPLMTIADRLLDPSRPAELRFQDLRTLRQLLDEQVRSAGGDSSGLWK
jgi:hypothetical protein